MAGFCTLTMCHEIWVRLLQTAVCNSMEQLTTLKAESCSASQKNLRFYSTIFNKSVRKSLPLDGATNNFQCVDKPTRCNISYE